MLIDFFLMNSRVGTEQVVNIIFFILSKFLQYFNNLILIFFKDEMVGITLYIVFFCFLFAQEL
jgi:hypothetical protein